MDFRLNPQQKRLLMDALMGKYGLSPEAFTSVSDDEDLEVDEAPGYFAGLIADVNRDVEHGLDDDDMILNLADEIASMPEYEQIEDEF